MSETISFTIEIDQIAALKRTCVENRLEWREAAQQIFSRGLALTVADLDERARAVSSPAKENIQSPAQSRRKDVFNYKDIDDEIDSDGFRQRMAALINRPAV